MPLDTEHSRIAHLLRRAGFGFTEDELDDYTAIGYSATLQRLIDYDQVDDSSTDELVAGLAVDQHNVEGARYAWLMRMLSTRRPLQEKMVLFWHTHFATGSSKVRRADLLLQQLQLFRDHALGSFEMLLRAITRDPAMLIWLDNTENRVGQPNENYAREVMELFTVGIGHFTDQDVKAAARAFTGYGIDPAGRFTFDAVQHDGGDKTFLGVTGNWDADDILTTLARHPATSRFVSARLFRYFVHDSPDPATIDRLADTYIRSGFQLRAVVGDLLSGPEFLSSQAYRGQVKQPVDLVVGSLKALNVQNVGADLPEKTRRMGQDLLNPPDVNGWKGGDSWISTTTLIERFNFADCLTASRIPTQPYFVDVLRQLQAHQLRGSDEVVDFYLGLLVDDDVTPETRQTLVDYLDAGDGFSLVGGDASTVQKVRGMLHIALSLPTHQLA
jgi:uncharacterized protein (DUF1800 family)